MRRILLALTLVLCSSNLSAAWDRENPERIGRSRHYIAPATVAVRDGVESVRPLSGGRQLLRVAPGVTVDASFERLTAERKIDRQALRAATAGRPFLSVTVQFHDDVPFEAAMKAIYAAGGTVADPLQHRFDAATRVRARVPSSALLDLAADERVLLVFGPRKLKPA
ncbi:MAG TPA: hypothetical protein VM779_05280, partial [Thermoanaerobaculia bacterium]|nr:hypothetical protein [Thermoanaerobaculia bacterium]